MTSLPSVQDQPKTSHTTPFSAPWLRLLRAALGSENGRPILMSGMKPTDYQKRHITAEIDRIRARLLVSIDRKPLSVELARLLTAFPSQDLSGTPAELRMEGYLEALANAPAWAVGEARARILRGEVELSHRFCPTPPELAVVVRLVLQPLREDLNDLLKIQAASDDREPAKDERERVVAGFEKLKFDLKRSA